MGLLEDSLRQTFGDLTATAPATEDLAGRAIASARQTRRRRTLLGGAAALTSVVLAGVGAAAVAGAPGGGFVAVPPILSEPVPLQPLPVDVVTGSELRLTTGRILDLAALDESGGSPAVAAEFQGAWRVADGWLIETRQDERSAVWFIDQRGVATMLADGQRVAVGNGSFHEPRVAWGGGGRVSYASFRDGALLPAIETGGVGELLPETIVGTGVLLGQENADGQVYDMWFPARGNYVPGPQVTHPFLGISGDGGTLFGLVTDPEPCLAKIEPSELHRSQRLGCELDISPAQRLFASPDLKWIVSVGGDRVELHDAATMWTAARPIATWPIPASQAVWLPDGSFVVDSGGELVRLFVDAPERRERTPVAGGPDGDLVLVVDLR